jgi:hypothetical protein
LPYTTWGLEPVRCSPFNRPNRALPSLVRRQSPRVERSPGPEPGHGPSWVRLTINLDPGSGEGLLAGLVIAAVEFNREHQRRALRDHFGSGYSRAVETTGNQREAEEHLKNRLQQRERGNRYRSASSTAPDQQWEKQKAWSRLLLTRSSVVFAITALIWKQGGPEVPMRRPTNYGSLSSATASFSAACSKSEPG